MFRASPMWRDRPAALRPRGFEQPASGYPRIACGQPCQAEVGGTRRDGVIWNLSVLGVYLVFPPPLPALGETMLLTFALPDDPEPITAQARVKWLNPPSIFKGCGTPALALPPGCGLEFLVLDQRDAERISARVKTTRSALD